MKKHLLVLFFASITCISSIAQYNYFDSSFSEDGIIAYRLPSEIKNGESRKVAIQQDNKIVSAGSYYSDQFFFVTRAKTDGTADSTFGVNGAVKIQKQQVATHANPYVVDLLIQPDSKILVLGYVQLLTKYITVLFRLETNGKIDRTFGDNGFLKSNIIDSLKLEPWSFALQSDGKIVVNGQDFLNNYSPVLLRFNSNGTTDNSFGNSGFITQLPFGTLTNIFFRDIAVDSRDRIICSGFGIKTNYYNYSVAMAYLTNGKIDKSFADNGLFITNFGHSTMIGQSADFVKILAGDKILLGSTSSEDFSDDTRSDLLVGRLNPDGSFDNTFGNNGQADRVFLSNPFLLVNDMAVSNSGKITFAGTPYDYPALWQFNADGSIDNSFGNKGEALFTEKIYGTLRVNSIVYQSDNKLVGAGLHGIYPNDWQCLLFRLKNNTDNNIADITNSNLITIKDTKPVKVYPNPAHDFIHITGLNQQAQTVITITDQAGKALRTTTVKNGSELNMNISYLKTGIYFIQINDGQKKLQQRILKQ